MILNKEQANIANTVGKAMAHRRMTPPEYRSFIASLALFSCDFDMESAFETALHRAYISQYEKLWL